MTGCGVLILEWSRACELSLARRAQIYWIWMEIEYGVAAN